MPKWGFKLKTDKIFLSDVNKIKYIASRKFFGTEEFVLNCVLNYLLALKLLEMNDCIIGMQTTSVS